MIKTVNVFDSNKIPAILIPRVPTPSTATLTIAEPN